MIGDQVYFFRLTGIAPGSINRNETIAFLHTHTQQFKSNIKRKETKLQPQTTEKRPQPPHLRGANPTPFSSYYSQILLQDKPPGNIEALFSLPITGKAGTWHHPITTCT
jgi:hypothetical protein